MNVSKISKFIPIASIIFLFFAFSNSAYAGSGAGSVSIDPTTGDFDAEYSIEATFTACPSPYFYLWLTDPNGLLLNQWACENPVSEVLTGYELYTESPFIPSATPTEGIFHLFFVDNANPTTNDCSDDDWGDVWGCIEGDDFDTITFTISEAEPPAPLTSGVLFGRSGESQAANQSGGSLLAAVGFVSTDTFGGIFPYLMLSVGVVLGFYIIQKIAMILGGREVERDKNKKK